MAAKKTHSLTTEEFINAYNAIGPEQLAKHINYSADSARKHASRLRAEGYNIPKRDVWAGRRTNKTTDTTIAESGGRAQFPGRITTEMPNGSVVVFSDAHYWPGEPTTAHRALVKMIHELEPAIVVCNGDAVDMASASRHPPIGWEKQPTIQEEIEAAQDRLNEIIHASPKKTRRTWNLGNHDARFETRIASVAPEYAKVAGIHLHDHFPEWERAWSTWINDDVVIKHRFKGGDHATWNNVLRTGKTTVTGHLHSANVRPLTDYNGTRYGVDTGCIADTFGAQFTNYTEDNPRNWISGFGVLTFVKGKLLWPELVTVWDKDTVQFRGKLINV